MTSMPLDLLDALPHRPPFRFLTSVTLLEPEASGEAVWYVDGTESFFAGHFPDRPIVPGLLIAEALAQLSGLIAYPCTVDGHAADARTSPPRDRTKLAHVDIRFKDAVVPPAELLLRSRMVLKRGAFRQFEVEARSDQKLVARGRLTLAGPTNWTAIPGGPSEAP